MHVTTSLASSATNLRVAVDLLRPAPSGEHAAVDRWMKDVAPSVGLRTWFGHDPAKFAEFRARYLVELATSPGPLQELRALGFTHRRVTLVYAARDETHNHAHVLLEALSDRSETAPG